MHFNSAPESQCTTPKLRAVHAHFYFNSQQPTCVPISLLFKISPGFGCCRERRHDKGIEHHALPELLGLNHPVTGTLSWKDLPAPWLQGSQGVCWALSNALGNSSAA